MLKKIEIQGYKCLKNSTLELSNLNLLVGANASGKSSVLQTILLLRQSSETNGEINNLLLQGELFEGGLATDILHPEANRNITINIESTSEKVALNFYHERHEYSQARHLELKQGNVKLPYEITSENLIYLNAERVSPKLFYSIPPEKKGLSGRLGKHGEYTTSYLANEGNAKFLEWEMIESFTKAIMNVDGIDLEHNLTVTEGRLDIVVNEILSWIIPGAHFDVEENSAVDTARLQFIRDNDITKTKVRPTHIGFGLTYLLPVITGALALDRSGILIVENPEAHLHPFSQSRIGVFLAVIANMGRQIFIETHSDHVLNGIRLAVAKKTLDADKVSIFSFERPREGSTARMTKIHCNANGRLDKWPRGFFDQIENDLAELG